MENNSHQTYILVSLPTRFFNVAHYIFHLRQQDVSLPVIESMHFLTKFYRSAGHVIWSFSSLFVKKKLEVMKRNEHDKEDKNKAITVKQAI